MRLPQTSPQRKILIVESPSRFRAGKPHRRAPLPFVRRLCRVLYPQLLNTDS